MRSPLHRALAGLVAAVALASCGGREEPADESRMVVNLSQYLEVFNPGGPSRVVATPAGAVDFRLSQLATLGARHEGPACAGYLPGLAPGPGAPDAAGFVGYALIVNMPDPQHRSSARTVGFEPLTSARAQALSPPRRCAELGLS